MTVRARMKLLLFCVHITEKKKIHFLIAPNICFVVIFCSVPKHDWINLSIPSRLPLSSSVSDLDVSTDGLLVEQKPQILEHFSN